MLSDSCHSGSAIRMAPGSSGNPVVAAAEVNGDPALVGRAMPEAVKGRVYRANREFYDGLQKAKPKSEADVKASVLLISGCQDAQTSLDGAFNGAFTGALLRVWNEGAFEGSYRTFHKKIQNRLPATQQPNLMTVGGPSFVLERPFKF